MRRTGGSAVGAIGAKALAAALALAGAAGLAAAAPAQALTVGDAYANQGANACSWTFGTAAVEKTVALSSGTFALTSFKNKLAAPVREYVQSAATSNEVRFLWDGATVTGATPGWSCASGRASTVTVGGQPAIELTVTIARSQVSVTKRYVVHPSSALIREWAEIRNADTVAHALQRPSFLEQNLMGNETGDTTLRWMTGARSTADAWTQRSAPLSTGYARTFDSHDRFNCSQATTGADGWSDMTGRAPSGYLGMREWHDATGGYVWPDAQHPGLSNDTARSWTVLRDGVVDVSGRAAKMNTSGDGVVVSIELNGTTVWGARTIAGTDTTGIDTNVSGLGVRAGDVIRFVISNNGTWNFDATRWDPTIAYRGAGAPSYRASSGFALVQGDQGWRYQDRAPAAERCTIAGWAETSANYIPWLSLWNGAQDDGMAIGFDYLGRWSAETGRQDGRAGALSLTLPNYSDTLAPDASVTLPKAFTHVYVDDLDDMTNRLLDWQYRYMWDYTRPDYFAAVRMLGDWNLGSQWIHRWDQAGTLQKVFGLTARMRTIGADTYHRDNGWWDKPGSWNGPDFRVSGDYLSKSGMRQLVYMFAYNANGGSDAIRDHPTWFDQRSACGYAELLVNLTLPVAETWMRDLLVSKAEQWGDFQWRNDSCPVGDTSGARQLGQDQAFRRVQQGFLDQRPGSAIQGVDSGGNSIHYEFMRMASSFSFSDSNGLYEQYDASRLFPADKLSGIPDLWNPRNCNVTWNVLLMFNPDFTGDPDAPAAIECMRALVESYHYLLSQQVAGRWSKQYHPRGSDADRNWFQRVSADGERSLVIYRGSTNGSNVTVFPKGLDPRRTYDVRCSRTAGSASRSGADLMANGVTFASLQPGELVWLGMPKRPGGGQDAVAPRAPSQVSAHVRTNMGHAGVEVTWAAGSDDNWLSRYEILRDGVQVGSVAKGRVFFDTTPGASPNATYAVRTVDGDGNRSATAASSPFTADTSGVEDDARAVRYSGAWQHRSGVADASGGTVATSVECRGACQGFGPTQGGANWRYQDLVGGRWQDIAAYRASGFMGMREWHDASGGYVWPDALHPGPSNDTARTWIAPRAGSVDVLSHVAKLDPNGDGVIVKITKNGATAWGPRTLAGNDADGFAANVTGLAVAAGDAVRFEIDRNGTHANDATRWDPWVTYQDDPPPNTAPPSASYTFTGSQITWLAKLGPDLGRATVSIDGVEDATIDLYAPDENNWSIPIYTKTFPTVATRTITVTQAGTRHPLSSGVGVSVDGFQALTNAPGVVENGGASIALSGGGWSTAGGSGASGGSASVSATAGDTATVTFTGRRITWVGRQCAACGRADVWLDGGYAARVDTFGMRGPTVPQAALYQATFPTAGPHTLQIRVLGRRNYDATGDAVTVDAFHVRP